MLPIALLRRWKHYRRKCLLWESIKTWSFFRDERVQAACTIGDLKLRRHKRSSGFGWLTLNNIALHAVKNVLLSAGDLILVGHVTMVSKREGN